MANMNGESTQRVSKWIRFIKHYERIVVFALMVLLMIVVGLTTVELGWLLVRDLSSVRVLLLDVDEMLELFGFFLLVLIGVELLAALKVHVLDGIVHVEVVLEVALIAVAQKVIVLDATRVSALSLFALAALVVALAAAFWWVRVARSRDSSSLR